MKQLSNLCLVGVLFCAMFLSGTSVLAAKKGKQGKTEVASQSAVSDEEGADSDESGCKAELLMAYPSGEILFEQNARTALPPASMIKLLTAYTIKKQISQGLVKPTDMVTASAFASKLGGSQVYLKEGEQFTVAELFEALMIQSANDAAVALAEHIGGSSAGFVELMRAEADSLGLADASINSPHGLPPGKGQEMDLLSAYDLAILGKALITEYPEILEISGKFEAPFRGGEFMMRNHNHLLRMFPGCDGLKTGYITKAGFGVTATAQRGGARMIAVAMGCGRRKDRESEASRLLSLGLSQFRQVTLIEDGGASGVRVPVSGGAAPDVSLVASAKTSALVKIREMKTITQKKEPCQVLPAPVAARTKCGSITFMVGDRAVGKVDLVAGESVEAGGVMGWLKSWVR